ESVFFQAEDGIREFHVTGVQTCALPIYVTGEEAVAEFVKEYQIQYGELDAIVMLVGGFASGNLETTTQAELTKMFQLNFFSAFQMVQGFLPLVKKQQKGTFLFVGARPALQLQDATGSLRSEE